MGFLSGLVSGGIEGIANAAVNVIDELRVDDEERGRVEIDRYVAETEREKVLQAERLAQMEVNTAEAQHSSIFVAGWRPFVGWVAGIGFGFHVLILPAAEFMVAVAWPDTVLPEVDTVLVLSILGGMLGIQKSLRTVEKTKGVARDGMRKKN